MKITIPTYITFFRLILVPLLILFYLLPTSHSDFIAAFIFTLASITDWLDGYLARSLKQSSKLGAFLDPVADKIIVGCALILITYKFQTIWIALPACIMISREILVSSLREWMAEIGDRAKVKVSFLGKVKTFAQMFSISFLIWNPNIYIYIIGLTLLYIAVILTIWSMIDYLNIVKNNFKDNN